MPEFHLPSYKTREEQTKGPWTPGKGARRIYRWVQDTEENWGRSLRAIFWKKAQYLSRKICYSFPGQDICHPKLSIRNMYVCYEKYISICSDSQAALKALQTAKTTYPMVQQCQTTLNNIATGHSVGLFWFP